MPEGKRPRTAKRGSLKHSPQAKIAVRLPDYAEFAALLRSYFAATGTLPEPDEGKLTQLYTLLTQLYEWNHLINLTAIKDPYEAITLHLMDSAVISPLLQGQEIADVGTGAGFPGLVLAVLNPSRHFTLIDAVAKKISFVMTVAGAMGLGNVTALCRRCEDLAGTQLFDCVVCRAFAPLGRLAELCLPLVTKQGLVIAMKGRIEQSELCEAPKSVKIERIIELQVPGLKAARQAVLFRPERHEEN